jgi:nucleolar protein 56
MKAYIVQSPLGIFAFDEEFKVIDQIYFPRDAKKIAEKLVQERLTQEEEQLIEKLKKKGYSIFISSKKDEVYREEKENQAEKNFRQNFRVFAKQAGFSDLELNSLLSKVGIELTRMKIKEVVKKDKIIIQAINAMDEINKSINIFIERLREWYGLHFPEMGRLVEKHEKYVKIVAEYGLREKIEDKDLNELKKISMGIELSEKDEEILKEYAMKINELYKLREHLENYIDHTLKEIAPNLRETATPLLAARLIALSGGLDKLAKKPSSTIQLLGAEKALFRYLHGRGKSPKYGLLFTHAYIQNAPQDKRGKIARVLASKISIAAKMDYYGKTDKSQEMKKDLEERIKRIIAE